MTNAKLQINYNDQNIKNQKGTQQIYIYKLFGTQMTQIKLIRTDSFISLSTIICCISVICVLFYNLWISVKHIS